MSTSTTNALQHLDGTTYTAILDWLERALQGREPLPVAVPGEFPEGPILRLEDALTPLTREDLRKACRTLVRRYVREPEGAEDDYVSSLLLLAQKWNQHDVATDLQMLAAAPERFSQIPPGQQKTVLSTLLDLRVRLPVSFWQELSARDPRRFGVVAFSSLLRLDWESAVQILPHLSDKEIVADQIYIILGQEARNLQTLPLEDRDRLITATRTAAQGAPPSIRAAVEEWVEEQKPTRATAPARASSLAAALTKRGILRNQPFARVSCDARIIPHPQGPSARP